MVLGNVMKDQYAFFFLSNEGSTRDLGNYVKQPARDI